MMEDNTSGSSGNQNDGKDVSIGDLNNEDASTEVCEAVIFLNTTKYLYTYIETK